MKNLEYINKMNLGEILYYCQRNEISTKPSKEFDGCRFSYDRNCVFIDRFAMQTNNHDTGYSTLVYIIGGETPYEILNGTYWKRSGYDFNKFHHEHGAWDNAFKSAIAELRKLIFEREEQAYFRAQAFEAGKLKIAEEKKKEIESLFIDNVATA